MTSTLFINASRQVLVSRNPPALLLLLASVARKTGNQVHVIDYDASHLDFGLLADRLADCKPQWVLFHVDPEQAQEAYRIGRFIASAYRPARIVYAGPHVSCFPEEPFELGSAAAVIRGTPFTPFAQLLANQPLTNVPHVFSRQGVSIVQSPTCADAYEPDALACDWRLVDRTVHRMAIHQIGEIPFIDLHTAFSTSAACPACEERIPANSIPVSRRSTISILTEAKEARDCFVRFCGEDLLADSARILELSAAMRSQAIRWIVRSTPDTIACVSGCLAECHRAGCIAVEICISNADAPDVALKSTDAVIAAGMEVIHLVTPLAPGDTLTKIRQIARIAYASYIDGNRPNVRGKFFLHQAERMKESSGLSFLDSQMDYVPDRISFVPASLLSDVPLIDQPWPDNKVLEFLQSQHARIRERVEDQFYLPMISSDATGTVERLFQDALEVYGAVDGRKTVGELVFRVGANSGTPEGLCSALLLLAQLGFVRSRDDLVPTKIRHDEQATTGWSSGTNRDSKKSAVAAKQFFCSRPWTGFEVGSEDGAVHMCCWAKKAYGNVNTSTIEEIWNGPIIQDIRQKMAEGRWEEICQPHCPYINGWMADEDPERIETQDFADNFAISLAEIAQRRLVLASLPRYWKIGHSTQCNLDCVMCYQDRSSKQTLPESLYEALPRYYPVMQELLLLGGEPLLIKRIRRLIDEFPHKTCPDVRFSIITNGTVFDERTIALASKTNLSWVLISIDAATPETYSLIRRNGVLERTLRGVARWKELSLQKGFTLLLSFTVMRDNIHEIGEFVELSRHFEVDCQFTPVGGEKGGQHLIDRSALRGEIVRALEVIAKHESTFTMPLAKESLEAMALGL